jgi:hypothetical protein
MLRLPRILLVAAALLLFGVLPPAVGAADGASFSIRPVRYDPARPATQSYFIYDVAPGQTIEDEVWISNTGGAVGTVRLYGVDGATGRTSGAVYLSAADPRNAVGAWIALAEGELTLQPGEGRAVRFSVVVPSTAAAGQHLGGLVAEDVAVRQGAANGALQINLQTRSVVAVQVNLPGPQVEQITALGVAAGGEQGYQQLILKLRNDGTMMVKPTGTLVVTGAGGNEVQRIAVKLDTFLPRTEIAYPVLVERQALAAGTYRASLSLAYGTGGATRFEQDFAITDAQVAQVFQAPAPLAAPSTAAQAATTQPQATNGGSPVAGLIRQALMLAVVLALGSTGTLLIGRIARRRDKRAE